MNTTKIGFADVFKLPLNESLNSDRACNYEVPCVMFSTYNGGMHFDKTLINIVEAWKYPCTDADDVLVCRTEDGDFVVLRDNNTEPNLSAFKSISTDFEPSRVRFGLFNIEPSIGKSSDFFCITGFDSDNGHAFVCKYSVDEISYITYFTDRLIKVVGKNLIVYGFVYP